MPFVSGNRVRALRLLFYIQSSPELVVMARFYFVVIALILVTNKRRKYRDLTTVVYFTSRITFSVFASFSSFSFWKLEFSLFKI